MTHVNHEAPMSAPAPPRGRGCAPWAIGCGTTLAVVLVLGGGAAWWFVGRPLLQVYQAIQGVQNIEALDARVRNRSAFAAPADGLLTEGQVTRFLGVQRRMGDAVAGRLEGLERRFTEIDGRDFRWSDALRLAGAYTDVFELLIQTKETQIAALDDAGFSVAEYGWVRREVLRAAGIAAPADVGAFVGAMTGEGPAAQLSPAGVPPVNRELVERYREALDEIVFLAAIGL
jgi:hypothetical protein